LALFQILSVNVVIGSDSVQTTELKGWTYALDGEASGPEFQFISREEKTGRLREIENKYLTQNGEEAVVEKVRLEGGQLIRYELHQNQTQEKFIVEVKGKEVRFTEISQDGRKRTSTEKLPERLIVGPIISDVIQANQEHLAKGNAVDFRLAVADRRSTYSFKVYQQERRQEGSKEIGIVGLKPTSRIVAIMVKDLRFVFNLTDRRIVSYQGDMPMKLGSERNWRDFYGITVFEPDLARGWGQPLEKVATEKKGRAE
jgi:hypothetical protein